MTGVTDAFVKEKVSLASKDCVITTQTFKEIEVQDPLSEKFMTRSASDFRGFGFCFVLHFGIFS